MNIAFVSTYQSECGIATYTENLAKALVKEGHSVCVLAELLPKQKTQTSEVDENGIRVLRLWRRGFHYGSQLGLESVVNAIKYNKPDVVHIQHEFGLFENYALWALVKALQQLEIKVFVTLHTVMLPPIKKGFWLDAHNSGAKFVVHSAVAQAALAPYIQARVVPHGVTNDPIKGCDPNKLVGLCPGFISKSKGHLEIVKAFAEICTDAMELNIVGLCRDAGYEEILIRKIEHYGLEKNIKIYNAFHTNDAMREYFANSDYVLLGMDIDSSPYSASGQLHTAIGFRKPIIAKDVPIYRIDGNPGVLYYKTPNELQAWINAVQDVGVLHSLEVKNTREAHRLDWKHVARSTVECYNS